MNKNYKFLLTAVLALSIGVFMFAGVLVDSASANQYCANGTSMTAAEFVTAMGAGKVVITWTSQSGQTTAHISNTTGCTAPLIVASYKVFITPPAVAVASDMGWLSTQQFIADSGVVNINANGNTDINVSIASCMTQVDLWYQTAPHSFTSEGWPGYTNFHGTFTPGAVCTYPVAPVVTPVVAPVVVPAQVITQTQSNNQNVYVNTTPATATTNSNAYTYQNSNSNYSNNYSNNNNYNNYNNNCTDYAYKLCQGNNVYWYNSCGISQGIFQSCTGNSTCQNTQCTNTYIPVNTYSSHYSIKCYGNNLYWYDTYGSVNNIYKTCNDNNTCSLDSCSANKCSNTVKCDGSTCATSSADYVKYCSETNANNNITGYNGLAVSFFAKPDAISTQWQKTIQVAVNSQAYFMISAVNNTSSMINNVNVSANIPGQITSVGNLQINGVPVSGDIISGINVGAINAGSSKTITFEGRTQGFLAQSTNQADATASVNGVNQSDSLSINFNPSQLAASVSSTQNTSSFLVFIKRWYLWILVGLVLIFLFIIIFRRLSDNT